MSCFYPPGIAIIIGADLLWGFIHTFTMSFLWDAKAATMVYEVCELAEHIEDPQELYNHIDKTSEENVKQYEMASAIFAGLFISNFILAIIFSKRKIKEIDDLDFGFGVMPGTLEGVPTTWVTPTFEDDSEEDDLLEQAEEGTSADFAGPHAARIHKKTSKEKKPNLATLRHIKRASDISRKFLRK